jgi:hypothetical protein
LGLSRVDPDQRQVVLLELATQLIVERRIAAEHSPLM